MYCGKNKTALTSQRQIAQALLQLLDELPYSEISVSAICKRASVSRQTFYSLFESKENVITFALRNECCYAPQMEKERDSLTFRQVCGGFSRYITGHAQILSVLSRHDLMPLLRSVLREDFTLCLSSSVPCCEELQPYLIDYMAAGITSIAETYIRTGERLGTEGLEEVIYLLMRGEFLR